MCLVACKRICKVTIKLDGKRWITHRLFLNAVKAVNDYRLLSVPLLPKWQGNSIFRNIRFHINESWTLLLHKVTPWHQLLYACGRIHVIRHIQEYRIEVLENIQIVCFCCFHDAVHHRTCSGTGLLSSSGFSSSVFHPVLFSHCSYRRASAGIHWVFPKDRQSFLSALWPFPSDQESFHLFHLTVQKASGS